MPALVPATVAADLVAYRTAREAIAAGWTWQDVVDVVSDRIAAGALAGDAVLSVSMGGQTVTKDLDWWRKLLAFARLELDRAATPGGVLLVQGQFALPTTTEVPA